MTILSEDLSMIYHPTATNYNLYNAITPYNVSSTVTTSASSIDNIYKWKELLSEYTTSIIDHEGYNRTTYMKKPIYNYLTSDSSLFFEDDSSNTMGYKYISIPFERSTNEFTYNTPMWGCCLSDSNNNKIDRKRNEIRSNLIIHTSKRGHDLGKVSEGEWIAMQTLREMISESDYRKYLRYGFISIIGKSGKIYQIFRNNWHTKVFSNGVLIEEICVRITDKKIPPTDNVIAFKTIIETDEESFAAMGNVYRMVKKAA